MDFSLHHGAVYQTLGVDATDSEGTHLTASGSTNVKGAWVSLGTVPSGVVEFDVIVHKTDGSAYLIDIGIGADPNQVVVVPNLYIRERLSCASRQWRIPVALPAGQTLWGRCQSSSASKVVGVSVVCKCAGMTCAAPLGVVTNYGADTSDTSGVTIDPGGTANTKGAWVPISASTGRAIRSMLVLFSADTSLGGTPDRTSETWLFDIGVGAESNEKVVLADIGVMANYLDDSLNHAVFGPYEVNIPAGTRLAARCQCSGIDATDRLLDIVILGFD